MTSIMSFQLFCFTCNICRDAKGAIQERRHSDCPASAPVLRGAVTATVGDELRADAQVRQRTNERRLARPKATF